MPLRASAVPILSAGGLVSVIGLAGGLIAVRRSTSVDPIIALRARN